MGIRDVLNGNVLAFNNVKMIPVEAYEGLSLRFPKHDFVRDWFANLGMATLAFEQLMFDAPDRWDVGGVCVTNVYRLNIKKITPDVIMQLGKLIGMYVTALFFENSDNAAFVRELNVSQEALEQYLYHGLGFNHDDDALYQKLKLSLARSEHSATLLLWTRSYYERCFSNAPTPEMLLDMRLARFLSNVYGFFIDLFNQPK